MAQKLYKTVAITEELLEHAANMTEKYATTISRGINKSVLTGFYSCPMCGHKPEIISWYIKGTANTLNYAVVCKRCGYRLCEPYKFNNPVKALFFWNRNALALSVFKESSDED